METRWDPNQTIENLTGILQQRVAAVLSRGDTDKTRVNDKVRVIIESTLQTLSSMKNDADKKTYLNKRITDYTVMIKQQDEDVREAISGLEKAEQAKRRQEAEQARRIQEQAEQRRRESKASEAVTPLPTPSAISASYLEEENQQLMRTINMLLYHLIGESKSIVILKSISDYVNQLPNSGDIKKYLDGILGVVTDPDVNHLDEAAMRRKIEHYLSTNESRAQIGYEILRARKAYIAEQFAPQPPRRLSMVEKFVRALGF